MLSRLIATLCVVSATTFALPVKAEDPAVKETAKLNEDGKYCARIEVRSVAGLTTRKKKCRTLEEWEKAGYTVTPKQQ